MADLIQIDTDEEMDKYAEAELISQNPPPIAAIKEKTLNYNPITGRNDVLTSLSTGGYVKVGEEELPRIEQVQQYARTLKNIGVPFDMAEYEAAGFSAEEVQAAGVMPMVQEKTGRTEPLREGEQLRILRESGDAAIAAPLDQPLFEGAISEVTKGLARGGLVRPSQFLKENLNVYDPLVFQIVNPVTGEFDPQLKIVSREEKAEIDRKIAAGEMPYAIDFERLSEVDPASGVGAQVAGDLSQFIGAFAGVGKLFRLGRGIVGGFTQGAAADFLAYRGDEGRLTDLLLEMGVPENQIAEFLKTDPNDPDYVGRFKTALEGGIIGAALEPVLIGMGKTFRAVKDGDVVPEVLRDAVAKGKNALGETFLKQVQNAEARIAERGDTTLFSNPIEPAVDQALAMAGRAAGEAKPSAAELRRQANIQRFGYDPNDVQVDKVEVPTDQKPGIIAFHGSGADFDEFKLEKIGTGEGAQAFGYGLYFTNSEDIAQFYKSAVRQAKDLREGYDVTYKGQPFKNLGDTPEAEAQGEEYFAVNAIIDNLNKVTTMQTKELPQPELLQLAKEKAIEQIEQQIKSFGDDISEIRLNYLNESLDTLKSIDVNDVSFSKGKTYQVKMDVTPDELLDYDKPFDEQSLFAQQAILKTLDEMTLDDAINMGVDIYSPPYSGRINKNTERMAIKEAQNTMLNNFTVVRFLNDWSVLRGAENSGEELLEKHGVKGIKYKANRGPGARNVPETGSDNYVIFDDRLIEIMKKYGIVGPVAIAAMKSEEKEEI